VLQALRAGRTLTDEEREIHDRGLVSVLREHHDAIDNYLFDAYGWQVTLTDEEILMRLVSLNRDRAIAEETGDVAWLRPELQAPKEALPIAETLDLGEAAPAVAPAILAPWPKALPDQVTAIAKILATAPRPLTARDVARAFDGKRATSIQPVLEALAAVGQARRLADGRFAT
jgi:hypothetical protein